MLKAVGFTDADLKKPLIGVANTWIEIGPCNYHLRDLATHVKAGIRAAGGTPVEFNTVSISDGITMGTEGMRASLVSREVIADSIELVTRGNGFDGLVILVGCDKTIPAAAMALARLNVPGLVLYGGSIAPGHWHARAVTIQDVFEAVGANAAGTLSAGAPPQAETAACPRARARGGGAGGATRTRGVPPGRAPAAGSSRPTPWPSSASSWGLRRSAAAACRPPIRGRPTSAARGGSGSWLWCATASSPATSSRASRSRTRSRRSRRPGDRPTPSCT